MLQFAANSGLHNYVKAKLEGLNAFERQTSATALMAGIFQPGTFKDGRGNMLRTPPCIAELLLQRGADPNTEVTILAKEPLLRKSTPILLYP